MRPRIENSIGGKSLSKINIYFNKYYNDCRMPCPPLKCARVPLKKGKHKQYT